MKVSKEFKTGIFVVLAIVIFYFGFRFLKGSDFLSGENRFFIVYDDVEGLTASNPVLINGLSVGRVEKINLLQNSNGITSVQVSIKIDDKVVIRDSTKAILTSSDLLGGKTIVLIVPPKGNISPEEDTLLPAKEQAITELIKSKAVPILDHLDTTAAQMQILITSFKGTAKILNNTLSNFEQSSTALRSMLADNRQNIKQISTNVSRLTSSLVKTETKLNGLLTKLNRFGDTLNAAQIKNTIMEANRAAASLNQMLAGINRGEGTLGKLAKNDSLYRNLNKLSADVDLLMIDLKANPKRYVHFSIFGKKDKTTK